MAQDQLSLAIGKEGQNVRLAARLTGWKIDIKDIALYKGEQEVKTDENDPEAQDLDQEWTPSSIIDAVLAAVSSPRKNPFGELSDYTRPDRYN